ncbi:hypothetical protein ACPPVS_07910 [Cellulomonas sp. McL0617]|uniref:hypothetical protein n=1 Tax=Cellulomonas sp. McL0617 TaxID=3415675 RepID=UPI003CF14C4E
MDERMQVPARDDTESVAAVGDVANLIEIRTWLRDRRPAMTVDQFRARTVPHVLTPHRAAHA